MNYSFRRDNLEINFVLGEIDFDGFCVGTRAKGSWRRRIVASDAMNDESKMVEIEVVKIVDTSTSFGPGRID